MFRTGMIKILLQQYLTMMPVAPERAGTENLQPLGVAGLSTQLWLAPPRQKPDKAPTSVSLSDQGLVQVLEASPGSNRTTPTCSHCRTRRPAAAPCSRYRAS